MYQYQAVVTEIYDGDTITVDVDLGMKVWLRGEKIRLYGLNAPELRGPEREAGLKSRDWLREQILGKTVILQTIRDKTGKYGRWLGVIFLEHTPATDEDLHFRNINDESIAGGWSVKKNY